MEQRPKNYVAVKGAQIKLRKEVCALDMGQGRNYAAEKGAQIRLSKRVCA